MDQLIQQVVNGLSLGATYAVVALGFGLVFSVMGVINLAHPDFFMLGAFTAYLVPTLIGANGLNPVLLFTFVMIAAIVVTGALGTALEISVLRPLRGRYILIPFIATAGVSIMMQNGTQRIFGSDPVPVSKILPSTTFTFSDLIIASDQLVVIVTGLVLMVGISYYVRRTKYGRATRAISERPDTAASCGVNVDFVSKLTVGISTASAGIAGVSIGLLLDSAAPTMGAIFGIKSFVCMLVAGNKSIEGIAAVGLALGVTEALVSGYVSTTYRDAVAFGLLLAILTFKPNGLFGSYEHAEAGA